MPSPKKQGAKSTNNSTPEKAQGTVTIQVTDSEEKDPNVSVM